MAEPQFCLTGQWKKIEADGQECRICHDAVYLHHAWQMAVVCGTVEVGEVLNTFLCDSCKEEIYGRDYGRR